MSPFQRLWFLLLSSVFLACLAGNAGCEDESASNSTTTTSPADIEMEDVPLPAGPLDENPTPQPPHGGALLQIGNDVGQVEWLADEGILYFLNADLEPLEKIEEGRLLAATAEGPTEWPLEGCTGERAAEHCARVPEALSGTRDESRIIRFKLAGHAYRVRLPSNQILETDVLP